MTQEIELYHKITDPLAFCRTAGQEFAQSGMFGASSASQGFVIAMACATERKSPLEIVRTYHIIDGKLSKKSLAALAEFRGKGGRVKWINTGEDGIQAVGEFTFEGQTLTVSFSIEQAKRQGLVKPRGNWEKTPGNMLRARVTSNAIGMLCPEIFAGGDPEEEVSPEPKAITMPTAATAAPAALADPQPSPYFVRTVEAEVAHEEAPKAASDELSSDLQEQVANAIGADHLAAAQAWMVKEGWIKAGQNYALMSETRARRILNNPGAFIRAIAPKAA